MGSNGVVVNGEAVQLALQHVPGWSQGGCARSHFFRVWWNRSTLPQVCGW